MHRETLVLALIVLFVMFQPLTAAATSAGNDACPGEDVFFNPDHAQDIFVPPGYKVEVFAKGLNFPTNIAFRGNEHHFHVFVTEAGTSLPGRCNGADFFLAQTGQDGIHNPFLPDVRVLDKHGHTVRRLGRPGSVAEREDDNVLHAPTIGIAFENGFDGGRLFVSDSRQGVRGAQGPKNSSRIVEVHHHHVTPLIINLPTGDHPTEQITVRHGHLFWSQGSVTNAGVVGHDNGGPVGGPADTLGTIQQEIPCQDVVLSGNAFSSGDGHFSGGFLPHGVPGSAGFVVPAFTGASQPGMCSGAILTASLSDPQNTVRPVSWGYRNPFGIRFAPDDHPLEGALLVTENGEDERGARPTNNAPDRLAVTPALKSAKHGTLDYHGWPDRFGFLDSTQAIFNPIGGPGDDLCVASSAPGNIRGCTPASVANIVTLDTPVKPLLLFPPQPPVAPLAIEPTDVAVVGADFVPRDFAGGGNPGDHVRKGDALVTREGDFGFSPGNGIPILGHDVELAKFLKDGRIVLERFAFNCKRSNQVTDHDGRKRCTEAGNQAFVDHLRGINRPVDGKFGPDGAFYLVDFGAVRDFGQSTPDSHFLVGADAPLVQIPGTGVIWKISRK